MKRFSDKVILVTGAGRGLGQACALAFAREGARIVGVGRGQQAETAALVRDADGEYFPIVADLLQGGQSQTAEIVASAVKLAGRIDCLVNNAGIIRRAPAVDHSETDWNDVLHLNLTVPFFLSQAAARWWIAGGRERSPKNARLKIVNIA